MKQRLDPVFSCLYEEEGWLVHIALKTFPIHIPPPLHVLM